jgi:hypothetical protein
MPEYTFDLEVRLRRDDERLVVVKRCMSIYMPVYVDTAYAITRHLLDDGWTIEQINTINFDFNIYPTMYDYPD